MLLYIVPGGGGGTFAIIVICRGVQLNNGIAHYQIDISNFGSAYYTIKRREMQYLSL